MTTMALHSCSLVTHLPQRKHSNLIVEPAKDQWDWEITDYYIALLLFVAGIRTFSVGVSQIGVASLMITPSHILVEECQLCMLD